MKPLDDLLIFQLAVFVAVLFGVVMLRRSIPQGSADVQQIQCCRGSRDSFKDWLKRVRGKFEYVHVVVSRGDGVYRIVRRGADHRLFRCHCGKWIGWNHSQFEDPREHPEYQEFLNEHECPESQDAHAFAMDMIGVYGDGFTRYGILGTHKQWRTS